MLDQAAIDTIFARFDERQPEENVPHRRSRQIAVKIRDQAFKSLVSCMLSAQSLDRNTARASDDLFAVAATPEAILELDEERLQQLIKPCGLYRAKARNIRRMCRDLLDRFAGVVPDERRALMSLPGVGRKSADIMLRFVWDEPVVPVDTHVFRVARRLGLAQAATEAQLAPRLEERIPARYRFGAHIWILDHGKRVRRSRAPACSACFLNDLCERHGVVAPDR